VTRRGQSVLRFADQAELDAFRRNPSGYVSPTLRESEIQPSILDALRKHPRVAWAHRQNTAAGYLITPDKYRELLARGALKKNDARYLKFGWPGQLDNTGQMTDGRRLDVEVKSLAGKLRPEQEATIAAVRAAGGIAFVARCIGDVLRELA
jgi:hypothetical protein